ncbi:hypothetical protein CCMA1212_004169 [Trichoderma ghanense]|uniref:Uncharacterized protein n=1 Tax=Trichoderma ghanense TaxID=65468 RepID=A0ABY2H4X3_9HYPO
MCRSRRKRFFAEKHSFSAKHRSAPPNQHSPPSPRTIIRRKPPSQATVTDERKRFPQSPCFQFEKTTGIAVQPWRPSELSRPLACCTMPCAHGSRWPRCPAALEALSTRPPTSFLRCPAPPTSPTTMPPSTRLPQHSLQSPSVCRTALKRSSRPPSSRVLLSNSRHGQFASTRRPSPLHSPATSGASAGEWTGTSCPRDTDGRTR